MKILFVCFPYSVHAARYVRLLRGQGWDIHIFPAQDFDALHVGFEDVTYWPATTSRFEAPPDQRIKVDKRSAAYRARAAAPDGELSRYLADVMRECDFDVVHSMEFQHAGYLAHAAIEQVEPRPIWIATNYGSDIYLYGKRPEHEPRIRALLQAVDYYAAECRRDVPLARELGFSGRLFSLVPNSGGINLAQAAACRSPGPTSARRAIAVKGYQHFAGRALTVLEAMDRRPGPLKGYEINVYAPSPEVAAAAEALGVKHGLKVVVWPEQAPHEDMLRLHGRARVSIGNSLSDGISTSFLEAIAMGAFPIQSRTACADEWVVNGQGGFLVDPENPDEIAEALERALTDDGLVDRAAGVNAMNVLNRADDQKIGATLVRAYREVAGEAKARRRARHPRPERKPGAPLLTVITPSYNRADFLAETIDSVLNQSFADFKLIVIDDGSQDNTAEVVARYDDPRLSYVRHDNIGEVRTVNRGLRMVDTEYFTVVNSDDPLLPGSFEKIIEALEGNPERLMAYPDWTIIDEDSKTLRALELPDYDLHAILTIGYVSLGPGAVFRTEAIDKVGLRNPLLKYSADLDYVSRVALISPPLHVRESLATHRTHPGSGIVAAKGARMAQETLELYTNYAGHPAFQQSSGELRARAEAYGRFTASMVCGDFRTAARHFLRGLFSHPLPFLERAGRGEAIDVLHLYDALPDRPRNSGGADRFLKQAWRARDRASGARLLARAFLSDPVTCIDAARKVTIACVITHVRGLRPKPAGGRALQARLLELTRSAADEGARRTAERAAELAVAVVDDQEAWKEWAFAHQHAGELDKAVDRFRQARSRFPNDDDPGLHLFEGEALAMAGRLEEAVAAIGTFVEREPGYDLARYYLGSCLAALGRFPEADAIFRRPVRIGLHDGRTTDTRIIDFSAAARALQVPADPSVFGRSVHGLDDLAIPPNGCVHLIACDTRYFHLFFRSVLRSVVRNAKLAFTMHIHVVNPDDQVADAVEQARAESGVVVNYTYEHVDLSSLPDDARNTYLSCTRFLLAPDLIDVYNRPLLITDADQTVVSSLETLKSDMDGSDVGLLHFSELAFNFLSNLSASVFWVEPTRGGKDYVSRVRAYLLERMRRGAMSWHLDQAALNVVRLTSHDIRTRLLPSTLMRSDIHRDEDGGPPAPLFWSVTYSIAANAAKLHASEFTEYA